MALTERFGFGTGLIVGVQANQITGAGTTTVTGVRVFQTNLDSERTADIALTVNGVSHTLHIRFRDETLTERTITGKEKRKTEY